MSSMCKEEVRGELRWRLLEEADGTPDYGRPVGSGNDGWDPTLHLVCIQGPDGADIWAIVYQWNASETEVLLCGDDPRSDVVGRAAECENMSGPESAWFDGWEDGKQPREWQTEMKERREREWQRVGRTIKDVAALIGTGRMPSQAALLSVAEAEGCSYEEAAWFDLVGTIHRRNLSLAGICVPTRVCQGGVLSFLDPDHWMGMLVLPSRPRPSLATTRAIEASNELFGAGPLAHECYRQFLRDHVYNQQLGAVGAAQERAEQAIRLATGGPHALECFRAMVGRNSDAGTDQLVDAALRMARLREI